MLGREQDLIPVNIVVSENNEFIAAYYYDDLAEKRAMSVKNAKIFSTHIDGRKYKLVSTFKNGIKV